MKLNYLSWYLSTSVFWRRIALTILVPAFEYFTSEPIRKLLIAIAKISPIFGIAFLIFIFFFSILTAIVIAMFLYEFIEIGNKIKSKAGGITLGLFVLAWILIPLHLINLLWVK